jgi:hypothetical protein
MTKQKRIKLLEIAIQKADFLSWNRPGEMEKYNVIHYTQGEHSMVYLTICTSY